MWRHEAPEITKGEPGRELIIAPKKYEPLCPPDLLRLRVSRPFLSNNLSLKTENQWGYTPAILEFRRIWRSRVRSGYVTSSRLAWDTWDPILLYYHVLTGQDIPVTSPEHIRNPSMFLSPYLSPLGTSCLNLWPLRVLSFYRKRIFYSSLDILFPQIQVSFISSPFHSHNHNSGFDFYVTSFY